MTVPIALNGIGSTFANPGTFTQVNFASGPVGGSQTQKKILLIGNGTGSPAATAATVYGPDTPTVMAQESDVIALFNAGSNLHTMYRRFVKLNPNAAVYAIMATADTGTAASGTITFTTNSTAAQTARVWVEDDYVDTAIGSSDTVTQIATNVVNSVNSKYWWPVSASSTAGVVTLTAKTTGLEGNAIYVQAQILNSNGTTTVSPTANTALPSTTSGVSGTRGTYSLTNVLSAIKSTRYNYIIAADSDYGVSTSTILASINTQVLSMAQPTIGIRQRLIGGSQDSQSYVASKAAGLNSARAELIWAGATDLLPSSAASIMGAIYSLFEWSGSLPVNRCNFSLFPTFPNDAQYWTVLPSRTGPSVFPTSAQVSTMLNTGVSPIIGGTSNNVVFGKRITTYCSTSSNADYRVRDGHIPSVCDAWADDAAARTVLNFSGYNLGTDPKTGQPVPPNTITPTMWSADLAALINLYGESGYGLLTQSANSIAGINVSASGDRLTANAPLHVTAIADQFALLVSQV